MNRPRWICGQSAAVEARGALRLSRLSLPTRLRGNYRTDSIFPIGRTTIPGWYLNRGLQRILPVSRHPVS